MRASWIWGWVIFSMILCGCAPEIPRGTDPDPPPPDAADAGPRKPPPPDAANARDAPIELATTADRPSPAADRPPDTPRADGAADAATDAASGVARDAGPDAASDARAEALPDASPARDGGAEAAVQDGAGGAIDAGPDVPTPPPPPAARAPRPGDLAIVEILIDPAGTDLGREWFEIVSLVDEPLDLTGLHLADAVLDVALDGGALGPGGVLVLGQSGDPAHNGGVAVDRVYGTRLQLNNDADRVAVCLGACADGVVLDVFTWSAAPGPAYQGHAVVVDLRTRQTCPATAPFGSEGSFGTPGVRDPPCGGGGGSDGGSGDGGPADGP